MTADQGRPTVAVIGEAWGLFVAVGLLMLGNGLLSTLLGVRSELEGFATTSTGIIMAAYFAGFLAGSRLAPRALERVGHVRVFAALASLASAAPLVHAVFVSPVVWSAMRLVFGFCMAGLYVVAESWLNRAATNETRGQLLSVYMVVVMGGLAAGQLFLGVAEPSGFKLFVVASLFVSVAVVPISLSQGNAPAFRAPEALKFSTLWKLAPLGIVTGFTVGVTNGGLAGIGAVYATRVGLDPGQVAIVMGAALFGSVVLQWPIGLMSDRMPRRRAILFVTVIATVVAAAGTQSTRPGFAFVLVVMFLFGSLTFPMYSLAVSHVNDVVSHNQTVSASALLVFVVAVGAILGPLATAYAIDIFGPVGFFAVMSIAHGLLGLYALYRVAATKPPVGVEEQRPWRPIPARASAVLARVARVGRPPDSEEKDRPHARSGY